MVTEWKQRVTLSPLVHIYPLPQHDQWNYTSCPSHCCCDQELSFHQGLPDPVETIIINLAVAFVLDDVTVLVVAA